MFVEDETRRIVEAVTQASSRLTKTVYNCSMQILDAKLEAIRSGQEYWIRMRLILNDNLKMTELLIEWAEHHTDPGFDEQFAVKIAEVHSTFECERKEETK